MQKYLKIILIAAVLLLINPGSGYSQSRLKAISSQANIQWLLNRAKAESIAAANSIPVRTKTPYGRVFELQRFEHGIPRIYTTDNLEAAQTISSNKVWPPNQGTYGFALTGSSEILGEWDAGSPLTSHQEFGGRIIITEGSVDPHSTHVAGTLIAAGVDPNAHGMANMASLYCYDWNNDASEMAGIAAAGLHVSNHSYGLITGWVYNLFSDNKWVWFGDTTISGTQDYRFGFYDDEAQTWDSISYTAPDYLICKAAGNDRGEGPPSQPVIHWVFDNLGHQVRSNTIRNLDGGATGYNTLNGSSASKNVLVVGAIQGMPGGYTQSSDAVMTYFSCWGPTDDGRIKPDIVADGWNIYSTYSSSNSSYATESGTSMATPGVTGSVGLLLQEQRNLHGSTYLRSSTLRGLLIQTADDGGNPGPDYSFGWGVINTLHAAQLMKLDSADGPNSHISERQLMQGDSITIPLYSDGTTPLKVTICWTDPPGTPPPASLNPTTIMLVNDLDIRMTKLADHTTFLPWILDPANPSHNATNGDNIRDNVEQILIPNPSPGQYMASISHKNTLAGGSQYFSFIVSGNVFNAYPVVSIHPLSGTYQANPGDVLPESMKVYNGGIVPLHYSAIAKKSWLVPDTGSHSIAPADSGYLHFMINAAGLSQWTLYTDSISIGSNDTVHSPLFFPVTVSTRGPRIFVPDSLAFSIDSGYVNIDSLEIHNTGSMPLTVTVTFNDPSPPSWLSISGGVGTIGINDSLRTGFSSDATNLLSGKYQTSLKITSNDSVNSSLIIPLTINVFSGKTIHVAVSRKWNLVSVPIGTANTLTSVLFASATTPAFAYDNAYVRKDTLATGRGYWLKFNQDQNIALHGVKILSESVFVASGWNLIGSISIPVPVDSIGSVPPSMITSKFYGYTGFYAESDTIVPGKGYWIKVNQAGMLLFNNPVLPGRSNHIIISPISDLPPSPPGEPVQNVAKPSEFVLEQAYPNPFNPATTINYALPYSVHVSLTIYNLLGQEVINVVDRDQDAGYKSVRIDMGNLPSGVYVYRLTAGTFSETRKMILAR